MRITNIRGMNIRKDKKLYAILHKKKNWKEGLDFLTPKEAFCQVGTWWYQKDKHLNAHTHIPNLRASDVTQECVIVIEGKIKVTLFDDTRTLFHTAILTSGDFIICLGGGHSYDILENNTKVIECKNGPFISVAKDKILIE